MFFLICVELNISRISLIFTVILLFSWLLQLRIIFNEEDGRTLKDQGCGEGSLSLKPQIWFNEIVLKSLKLMIFAF